MQFSIKKISLLVLLISFNVQGKESNKAELIKVIDGDTIVISTVKDKEQIIRLAFIDAPELNQKIGDRSKKNLEKILSGKSITYSKINSDAFNRIVAVVLANGVNVGQKQTHDGYAWANNRSISNAYLSLESQARKYKKGIWNTKNPISPWVFRKTFLSNVQ